MKWDWIMFYGKNIQKYMLKKIREEEHRIRIGSVIESDIR